MSLAYFDGFAVPPGIEAPGGAWETTESVHDGHGTVILRYPAATAGWVGALCDALQGARDTLLDRDAAELAAALGRVGERFLDPADRVRRLALELLPATSGLSPEMATAVLDGMAADWTGERLAALLELELGEPSPLDGFIDLDREPGDGTGVRRGMAVGPALCVQIVAGSVPGVGVSALLRGLVVKAPTLLKPGRADVVLPVLFARALAEMDRPLAAALAVVYWPGGSEAIEDAALARADVVTAYGSDATVRRLRARTPVTSRFVPYHHRVSIAVIGREALTATAVETTAADLARALALFDQRGCVSPQLVYVEEEGECPPEVFAEALGRALGDLERVLPTGRLGPADASSLHQARGTAELTASCRDGRVIHGGVAAWTVLFEVETADGAATQPQRGFPAVGRVARVRPLAAVESLPELLGPIADHLQTIGVAGLGDRLEEVATGVARAGASRIVPLSALPFPPPWWHHDGRGPLTDLLRWVDLETE